MGLREVKQFRLDPFLNQTTNTMAGAKKSPEKQDEEYRVWYVGVTRSAKNLYLIKANNKSKEFKI